MSGCYALVSPSSRGAPQADGMKKLAPLAAAAFSVAFATPAHATGGLLCQTAGSRPVSVSLVIGLTAVSHIVQARLSDNGANVPVTIAQAWLDRSELRLDLTDPNAERHELRLRARAKGDGYDGSLWRNGKRRWVRCQES
jgi:hypothetical protein